MTDLHGCRMSGTVPLIATIGLVWTDGVIPSDRRIPHILVWDSPSRESHHMYQRLGSHELSELGPWGGSTGRIMSTASPRSFVWSHGRAQGSRPCGCRTRG